VAGFHAGQIVIADWRDATPTEPNKLRPAVVIEDDALFAPSYPAVILVPLTEHAELALPSLSVPIMPTPENGCTKPCYAVSHFVTATSAARVRATPSHITTEELARIRGQIATAIGLR
jgi:mRNA interferase MazF